MSGMVLVTSAGQSVKKVFWSALAAFQPVAANAPRWDGIVSTLS